MLTIECDIVEVGVIVGLVTAVLVSLWLGALPIGNYWQGLALNLGTDFIGGIVAYLVFDGVLKRRDELETRMVERKADLIAQMGSSVKDVAVAAAEQLARQGWLEDGSLRAASLAGANLEGARLAKADLREASLAGANLEGADLAKADLRRVWLAGANQQGANLGRANLQEANLDAANLQGANLGGANLGGANLQWAAFNTRTTLPDGTGWTPDTDMARFTDPDHPDFWRPYL